MNKNKPNILLITLDHQLWYRHGIDSGPKILRPAYDTFCKEAVSFENAVTVSPLCSPARRSMLSGLYPHNHGEVRNGINSPFSEETYYDALKNAGYECEYYGKWHAGPGSASDLGCGGFSPPGYSNPYLYQDYKDYLKKYSLPVPEAYVDFSESDRHEFVDQKITDLTKIENLFSLSFGHMVTPKETHECYYLATRAQEALEKFSKSDKPFCLRVDFWGPHQPYFPTKEFLDMYDEDAFEMYGSFADELKDKPPIYLFEAGYSLSKDKKLIIPNPQPASRWKKMLKYAYAHNTMCDYAAGTVLQTLKELKLDENTVVIWTADHGDGLGAHGGHIDKNCYLSEEVIRIPLAVRCPDAGAGRISYSYASNLDIPVTISALCGAGFNEKKDGLSLLPEIYGEKSLEREYFVSVSHGHFQMHSARAVCFEDWRYIYNKDMINELYNLKTDPYELENLINNPQYSAVRKKLEGFLDEWRKEFKDKEY